MLIPPLIRYLLTDEAELLLHPPSGSWIILSSHASGPITFLLRALQQGAGFTSITPEIAEIISQLHEYGLVSVNDQSVWSNRDLDHSNQPVNTLILKMVGYCNIACTYCYDYNKDTYKKRLSLSNGRAAIDGALQRAGSRLNILFHGGEPLLAFDTIKSLVAYARQAAEKSTVEVFFSVQTNGTRFTDDVVDFLIENEFSIGVSLDGPPEFNSHRVDFRGETTFDCVMSQLARHKELASRMGILTTVTRLNCRALLQIARYFKTRGVRRWDITVFQDAGRGKGYDEKFAPSIDELVASYFDLLDAVEAGEFDEMEVRPILHYIRNVISPERRNMCLRNGCGAAKDLISISADGSIEACDCITSRSLSLGHLAKSDISAALDSSVAKSIRARTTNTLPTCQSCDWRVFCGGTCLAKAGSLKDIDEAECALSMALFPEIFRRIALNDKLVRYAQRFD